MTDEFPLSRDIEMITPGLGKRKKRKLTVVSRARNGLLKKLHDPHNADDPRWVKRRLADVEAALARKEAAKASKDREKEAARAARLRREQSQIRRRES